MPAWRIAEGTSEEVIQDLLNEIHLGSVRGWAPYEKALQMKSLVQSGLVEDEVAERYRMTGREVRQHLAAVDFMDELFFPITADPTNPDHRSKYSYFLEFCKNGRIQDVGGRIPELKQRFAEWVRDGKIDTGAKVRRLPKIMGDKTAAGLLDKTGFDAAEQYLLRLHPEDQELYAQLERTRIRLTQCTMAELREMSRSEDRQAILQNLRDELDAVLETARGAIGGA
jgi:hypothetical protein